MREKKKRENEETDILEQTALVFEQTSRVEVSASSRAGSREKRFSTLVRSLHAAASELSPSVACSCHFLVSFFFCV